MSLNVKRYLTVFNTTSDYETFKSSEEFITPNVSLCRDTQRVHYEALTPPPPPHLQ